MMPETTALLDALEYLPAEEKRTFTEEVLRRALPFDSDPIEDAEVGAHSMTLFALLEDEDAKPAGGVRMRDQELLRCLDKC